MDQNCPTYGIEISDSDWEKTPTSVKQLVERMRQHIKELEQRLADVEARQQELLEKMALHICGMNQPNTGISLYFK